MNLQSIQFETYKAFKNKQEFKLKPITIVVGKNSSGKSALARLPLLIAQSLKLNSEEPLKIQFDNIEFGGSFTDLIYNKFSHGSLKMSIAFEHGHVIDFEVQNISETPVQIISKWFVKGPVLNLAMEVILDRDNLNRSEERYYIIENKKYLVAFKGLLPRSIFNDEGEFFYVEELSFFSELMDVCSNQIEYIGPLREIGHRIYSYSGSVPKKLGYKGEYAPQILGMSSFIDGNLLTEVGKWFKEHLDYEINVAKELKSFEVVLINSNEPTVQINIVDVGQGISQVLPLIVRCFKPANENSITIVEQPELHLHPAAHGDLAELFALTAKRENSTFVIETHSENMILRLRRLITEKKLAPSDVVIYWVDDDGVNGSFLAEITIDEVGDLSDWPKGVFSEDYEEILAINAAQKKIGK